MWISIGAYITKPDVLENLNTTTEGCPFVNDSWSDMTTAMYTELPVTEPPEMYVKVISLYEM